MENTFELIRQSQAGDKKAREQLVEENSGLVWNIVRRFSWRGIELEDLFQIGAIGLIHAIDKFDFSFDVRFSTYAVPLITGEIKRFLRDDGMIKVSRTLKENKWKIRLEMDRLRGVYGREPELLEVAENLGLEAGDVLMALEAQTEAESLYQTIYQKDGKEIALLDRLPEKRDAQEELVNHIFLEQLLDTLTENEQKLIRLRYYENMTQIQVAEELGISQVQVSRLEKKILMRMREQGS